MSTTIQSIEQEISHSREESKAKKGLFSLLTNYLKKRNAYYSLMNLSDRQLRDIGLQRGDIKKQVNDYYRFI